MGVAVAVAVVVGRVPGQRHLPQQHLPPVQHLAVGERSLPSACTVFAPAPLPLLPFAWVLLALVSLPMAVAFLFLVFFVLMPLVHPQPCLCVTQRSRSVRFGHADCVTCRCAISLPHCLCVALRSHSVRFVLSNCATYRCVVPVSHCCSPDVKPGGINFPGLRDPLAPRPIATGSDDEDVRQREHEPSHPPTTRTALVLISARLLHTLA